MDPCSLTASIITVLGAARAGCKALEKLDKTRRAPSQVGDLLVELLNFKTLLEEIVELVEQKSNVRGGKHLRELIERGAKLTGEITTITQKTWPSIHFLKLSEASRHRLAVLSNGTRLKELKDGLRLVSLDLAATLSLLSASSSLHLLDGATASIQLHNQNSNDLSTLLQKVTFIEESTRQLQDATGKLVLPMNDYVSTMSRLDLADSVSNRSTPSSLALTLTPGSHDSYALYDAPRRASDPSSDQSRRIFELKQSCVEWCSCQCHTRSTVGFPRTLKSFLGQLFIEYAFSGPVCNERGCQRWPVSSTKVTYYPPRYLMSRYVRFVAHHSPLDGPNLSVRVPRVMEWQHDLWKHANVGNVQAIKALFSEGRASPYDVNPRGCNALIYAAAHGNPQLAQFLLQAGADPELTDSSGRKPIELFYERAFSGQFDDHGHHLVKSMFRGATSMEDWRFTPLHKIILGLVDKDLEKELTVSTMAINTCDAQGRTALCWATIRDDISSVKMLLTFGADPNVSDYTGSACLHFARSPEVCRALLDNNADVRARNWMYSRTPLHSFCKRDGTVDMIEQLVTAGLEVDVRDADGETPLLNAIFRGFTSAVEKLLELGADPNARNISSCESSIHFAVQFDRHDILPLLLHKGVDYTARNIRGRNIGHMAARVASTRSIKVLSSSNLMDLDLSLTDSYGITAADYLSSRKLISQSDVGIHTAFAQLQRSCCPGRHLVGPHPPGLFHDLEAQDSERCKPPGAFPELADEQDKSKEEAWRDTISSFRCNYKSPCCYAFDAPRGVCSGVISYQSHSQVS
ncbi:MAG: hypothetical protein Q9201_004829 [Fulgogasparrea decipioides]